MELFARTVPENNTLFTGTVLENNTLFSGTVPANNTLFAGTANKKFDFSFFFSIVRHAITQRRTPAPRGMASQHLWTCER